MHPRRQFLIAKDATLSLTGVAGRFQKTCPVRILLKALAGELGVSIGSPGVVIGCVRRGSWKKVLCLVLGHGSGRYRGSAGAGDPGRK